MDLARYELEKDNACMLLQRLKPTNGPSLHAAVTALGNAATMRVGAVSYFMLRT
jgi:hypothetical protein